MQYAIYAAGMQRSGGTVCMMHDNDAQQGACRHLWAPMPQVCADTMPAPENIPCSHPCMLPPTQPTGQAVTQDSFSSFLDSA